LIGGSSARAADGARVSAATVVAAAIIHPMHPEKVRDM
jgi:hypothetical protein